jgi:hypothetical protein
VLFSRDDVAAYINQSFEPVWESVRPVPVVRIDFGGNKVITRTLNGNTATYVCASDGQLLDVIPGIYEPKQYQRSLEQLRRLSMYVDQRDRTQRDWRLKEYHVRQAEALAKNEAPHVLISSAGLTKAMIEQPTFALVSAQQAKAHAPVVPEPVQEPEPGVAGWKALADDTRLNETVRRGQIHQLLARAGAVRPRQVAKAIYKDVLHADLDDPYLGLGKTLFASYPFAEEEKSE